MQQEGRKLDPQTEATDVRHIWQRGPWPGVHSGMSKAETRKVGGGRVCSSPTQARHQEGGHATAVELHAVVPTVSHGLRCSMESGG